MLIENKFLVVAAALSFTAAFLHILVIVGGPEWYRFFGAGEGMATLAERGSPRPAIITSAIAFVLFLWGLYALSAAGLFIKLPLLTLGVVLITAIYLLRGIAGIYFALNPSLAVAQVQTTNFWWWSSIICMFYGAVHLVGLYHYWQK
jgi:putative oxidoreductase